MRSLIAISGPAGSGKTTIAKRLAEEANLRYWSNGEQFRSLAASKGISFQEFHKFAEKHPEVDRRLDERARKEAERGDIVLDGRLSGWLTRDLDGLKVYLTAPFEVRLKRVTVRDGLSAEGALRLLQLRERSNRRRYLKLYDYDIDDLEIYDMILNTQTWNVDDVLEILKFALRRHFRSLPVPMENHHAKH